MNYIFEKACAKINICLDITGIREDGYHEIKSIMQCVTFGDDIYVEKWDTPGITLECSDKSLPVDERNLAFKAAVAFFEHINDFMNIKITIRKNIPDKAGLAGGSADAAAVLRALNRLTESNLSDEVLREIAAKIGSDVVFCVSSDPSLVTGRGEIIEPCEGLPECTVVLAKSDDGMKTPEAYRALDKFYRDYSSRSDSTYICLDAMTEGDLSKIAQKAFNVFENVIIPHRPAIAQIKSVLTECGAVLSLMSGSGSAVFGLFGSEEAADAAVEKLKNNGAWAVACEPLS